MSDITRLLVKIRSVKQELETSRREATALRLDNSQLRGELDAFANPYRPAPQLAMNCHRSGRTNATWKSQGKKERGIYRRCL